MGATAAGEQGADEGLDPARLAAELDHERRARRQDQALIRAAQAVSSSLDFRDVVHLILQELREVVHYDTASVQELRGDQVVIVAGEGIDLDVFSGVGFDVDGDGAPNAEVVRGHRPVIVPDILGDHPYPNFPHPAHEMSGVRCWMGVPLIFGDECIGMITLDAYEPDYYTAAHADRALAFASHAALALQNARTFALVQREVEERRRAEDELRSANDALRRRMAEIEALQESLREQAVRDPLTGLFNRRYLLESLAGELSRCQRDDVPLALVLVDVDHFKVVNDTLGHEAGDGILIAIAELLRHRIREGDVACRYGGEEFVVVLPGTTLDVAAERADRWRKDLIGAVSPDGVDPVTISVGVAAAPGHGTTPRDLVRAADQAMYAAKAAGRDRVVIADPGQAPNTSWSS
ncbi:GGDEF domain-containing protein [Actinomarinicola tropica]|uniref:Diguanylate cyclase n=1 Tax=Actinomarinicola tropica TaxID=2789776 RepID=A0A5Q2RRQ7_9ACTN|nr:sensor domain-containing diguanylate cyclase [Actinomarinicola tropica]QGG96580.1 diguanylate cyclase [Actinomarinicola tropica]